MTSKKADENKVEKIGSKKYEKIVASLDSAKSEISELKAQLKKYKNCKCGLVSKEEKVLTQEEQEKKDKLVEQRRKEQDEKKQEVEKLKQKIDNLEAMLKSKLLQ